MDAGLVGSVIDSKYRVDGMLGRGGMAERERVATLIASRW